MMGNAMQDTEKKGRGRIFYGWWMVFVAAAVQFLAGGFYGVGFSVYFLPISRDLELSRTAISLAFSLRNLEGGLYAPLMGYLVDRFGPRFMIRIGGIFTGAGFILLAFTHDYVSFMLAFLGLLVLGINAGVALPASSLVNHWFARKRALAVTLSHVGVEIGGTILTPLVALLVLGVGWRQAAIISGLAFLVIVPFLAWFIRETPESVGLRPDGDSPLPGAPLGDDRLGHISTRHEGDFGVQEALKTGAFWHLAAAIGTRQFSKQVLMVHLIPLLVWKGFDEPGAAVLLGLFAFFQIPLRIVAAHAADRWSMTKVPGFSALAGVGAVIVLLLPQQGWVLTGLLFVFLFALAETGNSSGWAVIGDFFGRSKYASIRGAVSMIHNAISLPAPVVAGFVFDQTQSYQLALLPVAASYTVAFVLFWFLRRPQPRADDLRTISEAALSSGAAVALSDGTRRP
jgi:sugar phosphate permease